MNEKPIDKFREILIETIEELAKDRPVFHAEADFQHELSIRLRDRLTERGMFKLIRLEKMIPIDSAETKKDKKNYVDIYLEINNGLRVVIELKYKTQKAETKNNGEMFKLKPQGAQDLGGYFFLKDISNVEKLIKQNKIDYGFCIFLTNDEYYWKDYNVYRESISENFRIGENRKILHGEINWKKTSRKDSEEKKKNEKSWVEDYPNLEISKNYGPLNWMKYSEFPSEKNMLFKYLLVDVVL